MFSKLMNYQQLSCSLSGTEKQHLFLTQEIGSSDSISWDHGGPRSILKKNLETGELCNLNSPISIIWGN
jgi:hypothetical protein